MKIYSNPEELAQSLAEEWRDAARQARNENRVFNIALAGGSTPRLLYRHLTKEEFRESIPWNTVHLFFGDERCVPPDHGESNFRMVREALIDSIAIPSQNIHRIHGESNPKIETQRYAREIREQMNCPEEEIPKFDWMLLGLGTDGHTASIFPGMELDEEESGLCAVCRHPETGQERITLTLQVINNADQIKFMVTGSGKARIVSEIFNGSERLESYPAARVNPDAGTLKWYLDREAASRVNP